MLDMYDDLVKVIREAWNDKETLNIDLFKYTVEKHISKLANPNFKTDATSEELENIKQGKLVYNSTNKTVPISVWGPHLMTFANDTSLNYVAAAQLMLAAFDSVCPGEDPMNATSTAVLDKIINTAYCLFHQRFDNLLTALNELVTLEYTLFVNGSVEQQDALAILVRDVTQQLVDKKLLENLCSLLTHMHSATPLYYKLNHYNHTKMLTSIIFSLASSTSRPLLASDAETVSSALFQLVNTLLAKEHPSAALHTSVTLLDATLLTMLQVKSAHILEEHTHAKQQLDMLTAETPEGPVPGLTLPAATEIRDLERRIETTETSISQLLDGLFMLTKQHKWPAAGVMYTHSYKLALATAVTTLLPVLPSPPAEGIVAHLALEALDAALLRHWSTISLAIRGIDAHPHYPAVVSAVSYLLLSVFRHFPRQVAALCRQDATSLFDLPPSQHATALQQLPTYWLLKALSVYARKHVALVEALADTDAFLALLQGSLGDGSMEPLRSSAGSAAPYALSGDSSASGAGMSLSAMLANGRGGYAAAGLSIPLALHSPYLPVFVELLSALALVPSFAADVYALLQHSSKLSWDHLLKRVHGLYSLLCSPSFQQPPPQPQVMRGADGFHGGMGGNNDADLSSPEAVSLEKVQSVLTLVAAVCATPACQQLFLHSLSSGTSLLTMLGGLLQCRLPSHFKATVLTVMAALARFSLEGSASVLAVLDSLQLHTPNVAVSSLTRGTDATRCAVASSLSFRATKQHACLLSEAQSYAANPAVATSTSTSSLTCSHVFFALSSSVTGAHVPPAPQSHILDVSHGLWYDMAVIEPHTGVFTVTTAFLKLVFTIVTAVSAQPSKHVIADWSARIVSAAHSPSAPALPYASLPQYVQAVATHVYLPHASYRHESIAALFEVQELCLSIFNEVKSALTHLDQERVRQQERDADRNKPEDTPPPPGLPHASSSPRRTSTAVVAGGASDYHTALRHLCGVYTHALSFLMREMLQDTPFMRTTYNTVLACFHALHAANTDDYENNLYRYTAGATPPSYQLAPLAALSSSASHHDATVTIPTNNILFRTTSDQDALFKLDFLATTSTSPTNTDPRALTASGASSDYKAEQSKRLSLRHHLQRVCASCQQLLEVVSITASPRALEAVMEAALTLVATAHTLSPTLLHAAITNHAGLCMKAAPRLVQQCVPHVLPCLLRLLGHRLLVDDITQASWVAQVAHEARARRILQVEACHLQALLLQAARSVESNDVVAIQTVFTHTPNLNGVFTADAVTTLATISASHRLVDPWRVSHAAALVAQRVFAHTLNHDWALGLLRREKGLPLLCNALLRAVDGVAPVPTQLDSAAWVQELLPATAQAQLVQVDEAVRDMRLASAADVMITLSTADEDDQYVDSSDKMSSTCALVETVTVSVPYRALAASMSRLVFAMGTEYDVALTRAMHDVAAQHLTVLLGVLTDGVRKSSSVTAALLSLDLLVERPEAPLPLLDKLLLLLAQRSLTHTHPHTTAALVGLMHALVEATYGQALFTHIALLTPFLFIDLLPQLPTNVAHILARDALTTSMATCCAVLPVAPSLTSPIALTEQANRTHMNIQVDLNATRSHLFSLLSKYMCVPHGRLSARVLLATMQMTTAEHVVSVYRMQAPLVARAVAVGLGASDAPPAAVVGVKLDSYKALWEAYVDALNLYLPFLHHHTAIFANVFLSPALPAPPSPMTSVAAPRELTHALLLQLCSATFVSTPCPVTRQACTCFPHVTPDEPVLPLLLTSPAANTAATEVLCDCQTVHATALKAAMAWRALLPPLLLQVPSALKYRALLLIPALLDLSLDAHPIAVQIQSSVLGLATSILETLVSPHASFLSMLSTHHINLGTLVSYIVRTAADTNAQSARVQLYLLLACLLQHAAGVIVGDAALEGDAIDLGEAVPANFSRLVAFVARNIDTPTGTGASRSAPSDLSSCVSLSTAQSLCELFIRDAGDNDDTRHTIIAACLCVCVSVAPAVPWAELMMDQWLSITLNSLSRPSLAQRLAALTHAPGAATAEAIPVEAAKLRLLLSSLHLLGATRTGNSALLASPLLSLLSSLPLLHSAPTPAGWVVFRHVWSDVLRTLYLFAVRSQTYAVHLQVAHALRAVHESVLVAVQHVAVPEVSLLAHLLCTLAKGPVAARVAHMRRHAGGTESDVAGQEAVFAFNYVLSAARMLTPLLAYNAGADGSLNADGGLKGGQEDALSFTEASLQLLSATAPLTLVHIQTAESGAAPVAMQGNVEPTAVADVCAAATRDLAATLALLGLLPTVKSYTHKSAAVPGYVLHTLTGMARDQGSASTPMAIKKETHFAGTSGASSTGCAATTAVYLQKLLSYYNTTVAQAAVVEKKTQQAFAFAPMISGSAALTSPNMGLNLAVDTASADANAAEDGRVALAESLSDHLRQTQQYLTRKAAQMVRIIERCLAFVVMDMTRENARKTDWINVLGGKNASRKGGMGMSAVNEVKRFKLTDRESDMSNSAAATSVPMPALLASALKAIQGASDNMGIDVTFTNVMIGRIMQVIQ